MCRFRALEEKWQILTAVIFDPNLGGMCVRDSIC